MASSKIIPFAAARSAQYSSESDRENNVIGNRLAEARKLKGLTINTVCEMLAGYNLSLTPSTVYRWESGAIVPNAYQFVALCMVLDIEDDISGFSSAPRAGRLNAEGAAHLAQYRDDLIASGKYSPKPAIETTIEYITMPVSYLAVSAGTGEFLTEGNFEMVSFPKSAVPERADFGVRVNGDSMEPVYHDGQIVWVQETPDVSVGEEGIFIFDGCGYIKRLQMRTPDESEAEKYLDSEGTLHPQPVLISYNNNYAPIVIPPESNFKIVGRVL